MMVTGFDASILRAIVMTNLYYLFHFYFLFRIPVIFYLLIAAIFVVFILPMSVFKPGFWYSFLITYGLLTITPNLIQKINGPRFIVVYVCSTFTAVLIAFPIQFIQSAYFQPMSIVANLWISWMGIIVLFCGLIIFLISFLSLPVAAMMGQGLDFFVDVMLATSTQLFFQFKGIYIDHILKVALIASLILFLMPMIIKIRLRWCILVGLFINFSTLFYLNQRTFVMAIDVGQGDATLIVNGFYSVLIDTGGYSRAEPVARKEILPVLNYYGINTLDLLIITHHDLDHIGGLSTIVNRGVKQIYTPDELSIRHQQIFRPFSLTHRYLELTLFPTQGLGYDYSSNNRALIIHFYLKNTRFLITGDIDSTLEVELINRNIIQDIDVLKIGHHGSVSSTSFELLSQTSPLFAWNSCAPNHRYHHPHSDVVDRLNNHNIPFLSTHQVGAIRFDIFQHDVMIHSFRNNAVYKLNHPFD